MAYGATHHITASECRAGTTRLVAKSKAHLTSATTHRPHIGLVTFTERGHSSTNGTLKCFPLSETFHSMLSLDQVAKGAIAYPTFLTSLPFSTASQRERAALPLLHQCRFAPHSLQCLKMPPPNPLSRLASSSCSAFALDLSSCFRLWASSVSY